MRQRYKSYELTATGMRALGASGGAFGSFEDFEEGNPEALGRSIPVPAQMRRADAAMLRAREATKVSQAALEWRAKVRLDPAIDFKILAAGQ